MSIIFGIFNRTGEPINPEEMLKMYESVSYFPHESYKYKIVENVGFGHMLTYNTPESLYENQPVFINDQKKLFVFKGRIDNRKDLVSLLNRNITDKIPDGDIALQIYLKYKEKASDMMLGDWALASFDFETQELFISRDHHGYTAIHYYYDDKKIVFASSIKSIINLNLAKVEIDYENLSRLMAIWNVDNNSTYYKNIYILPAATSIKANSEKFNTERYWYPENIKVKTGKKTKEYAEELYDIFTEAVNVRLRSYNPVASMLSGGLDSGSVVYTASQLLKKQGKHLTTYSHVPLYELPPINKFIINDETPYINATVEASGNIKPIYLKSENFGVTEAILSFVHNLNTCVHSGINIYWLMDIMQSSFNDGFGVLLTGEHGNGTISFTGHEDTLPISYLYKMIGLKNTIKKKFLKPIALKNFPNSYMKIKGRTDLNIENFSYLNPRYINNINKTIKEHGDENRLFYSFKSHQDFLLAFIMPGFNPRCYGGGITSDYYGIEQRDPTADKRVIEYCLSIPNEMYFDKSGNNKNILREMMKNKLPDKVLFEKRKGLQSSDVGLRIGKEQNQISDLIDKLSKYDVINDLIDTKKLKDDFLQTMLITNNYNTSVLNNILRTVMVGEFIYSNTK